MRIKAVKTRPAHLLVIVLWNIATYTLGLELSVTRRLHLDHSDNECGQMKCVAEGDSATINTVTMTRVKSTGESIKFFVIGLNNPDNEVHLDNIYCNGTLKNNLATIYAAQKNISDCGSDLFVCNVSYTQGSRQGKYAAASMGPERLSHVQSGKGSQIQTLESSSGSGSVTRMESSNVYPSQLWFWSEKITKLEQKFQTLNDRLSEKITTNTEAVNKRAGDMENTVLQRVASVETDISTRVSRLEDRLASMLLSQFPSTDSEDRTGSLKDLKREVESIKELVNSRNYSGTDQQQRYQSDQPESCERGMGNDVTRKFQPYAIMMLESIEREILCDTHTDGGGWIIIQRRTKGDVDFYRDWTSYRDGFGSVTGDFWLGNEAIHKLTDMHPFELRIAMRHKGQDLFADYSSFRIEDESQKYRIHIGAYTGNAGDGLTFHNAMAFSTFDRDSDTHATLNCAIHEHGAWWYKNCIHSNLNGKWATKVTPGVSWYTGSAWTLPYFSEMKIRRVKSKGNPW